MPRHDDAGRMAHMLAHAEEAMDLARGRTRQDLDRDRQLNLSLVRLLEIIGEAAARVSPQAQRQHGSIPWPAIIGMRNRLIHGYDEVDFDILWEIVEHDLPALAANLRTILGS